MGLQQITNVRDQATLQRTDLASSSGKLSNQRDQSHPEKWSGITNNKAMEDIGGACQIDGPRGSLDGSSEVLPLDTVTMDSDIRSDGQFWKLLSLLEELEIEARNLSAMEIEQLKEYITNFSLDNCKPHGNQGYNRVLLQLFGYLGHGKSSFINTCKYILDESEFQVLADAGASQGGKTTKRIPYELTDTITMVDNRGCSTMNAYETGEIFAQLGNFVPLNVEVNWQTGYTDIMSRMEESKNYSDFIVPIFVYSVKKGIADEEVPEIKNLLDYARDLTGIVPIVVLTHKTQGNLTNVEAKFNNIGIDHIFKLENFTKKSELKIRSRHEEVLKFLREVLKDVEYRMRDKRDPLRERVERKKRVLLFVHDREIKRELQRR
ncbi:uncharacterized protein O3C94_022740 [Discoglossus pictus]